MSGDEALEVAGTSFPKEYKEPDSDDSKSKDQHTPEVTRHGDSELRGSKTGADESIQQEDQKSQSLKPDPKQATWSVSGIADWLGLGGEQEEEPVREVSKTAEQITFRRRKIAVIDDSDIKKPNDDGETEPGTWFQSTLADLMHFGSVKAGFGLQYKENYPDVQDISSITGDADHHGSTTTSDTQEEEPRDSIVSQSNWFDLDIRDVFSFGYSNENEVKIQKYKQTEVTSPKEESLPPSIYSTRILSRERTKTSESLHHEVQEKHVQEITEVKKTDSKLQLPNDCTDSKEAMDASISTEPGDRLLKSHYAEHSSVSESEIMENLNAKAIMKESERKNDQSGWYGSIYSSIFGFSSVKLDNEPSHDSVSVQRSQESVIKKFLPSHSTDQGFLPKDSPIAREENSGSPQTYQSFFSFSPFTNTLNAKCFVSKEKGNVQITVQALKSREGTYQSKKEDNVLHIKKESKVQLVGNKKVIEKDSIILSIATPPKNILLSSLATKNHEESREKIQGNELVKDNTSPFQSVKFRLEQGLCYGHHIQMATYGKTENLEIQDNFTIEDKIKSPVLKDKQCSSLELENIDDSLTQEKYTGEVYSHEKFAPAIEEPDRIAIDNSGKVDHSHLSATEIYLERLRKGEMTETTQDKERSHQATERRLTFKKLKYYTDHSLQMKDNSREGEGLHKISEDNKIETQQSREQMLSTNFEVIENTEIRTKNPGSIKNLKKCNDFFPSDTTGVNKNHFHNQNEEGAVVSQSTQEVKFPPSSRDLTDAPISEEKTSKCDEFQNFLSFNDYEHQANFFQSSTEEKDSLQRSQDNISSIDKNSQLKSCPQLRNKEMEKKEQFCHKYNLKIKKEGISNKDILLSSLAKQNKDSEGINLLKDNPSISSAEHPLGHTMESLFNNKKMNGKSAEDSEVEQLPNNQPHLFDKQHEAPILMFRVQKLSQDYKVTNEESTSGIQDVNEKEEMKKNFVSEVLERDYIDVMKREQVLDSLSSLQSQSEKHVNDNIQGGYVVDSYVENGSPDLKNEIKLCLNHTKDDFPTNSGDNNNLIKSVVPNESINQFSQNRIKEQEQLSQCVSELSESKQGHNMQDTENTLKKQINKNHLYISNNQEPSPVATSKDIPGNGTCLSKDDFINNRVQSTVIQVPHKSTAGKCGEEEHSSKPIQENFDHSKVSDASLTAKAVDAHGLKENLILSYTTSGTFSSKMPVSLPYLKENQKDLKIEQEVLSSHPELSDCEYTYILSQGLAEKCTCQMVHNERKHFPQAPDLDILKVGLSTDHKLDNF